MKEEEIARNLDEIAEEQAHGNRDLWPSIRTRLDILAPSQVANSRGADKAQGGLRLVIVPAIIVVLAMGLLYVALTTRTPSQSATQTPPTTSTQAPVESLSADEILDRIESAEAGPIESFHGVYLMDRRGSASGEFSHSRSERWYTAPNKYRDSDTFTEQDGDKGTRMWVTNGSTAWTYDSSHRANKRRPARAHGPVYFFVSNITRLLGDSSTIPGFYRGYSTMIQGFYNVKQMGTGTVAGRPTHILELTLRPSSEWPKDKSLSGGYALVRVWVDAEHFYVLQQQVWDAKGNVLSTEGYTSFELNEPVDPAVFDYVPPED